MPSVILPDRPYEVVCQTAGVGPVEVVGWLTVILAVRPYEVVCQTAGGGSYWDRRLAFADGGRNRFSGGAGSFRGWGRSEAYLRSIPRSITNLANRGDTWLDRTERLFDNRTHVLIGRRLTQGGLTVYEEDSNARDS